MISGIRYYYLQCFHYECFTWMFDVFYGLFLTPVEDRYGNMARCVLLLAAVGLFAGLWQTVAARTADDQFKEFKSDCPISSAPSYVESFRFFCCAFIRNCVSELGYVPMSRVYLVVVNFERHYFDMYFYFQGYHLHCLQLLYCLVVVPWFVVVQEKNRTLRAQELPRLGELKLNSVM